MRYLLEFRVYPDVSRLRREPLTPQIQWADQTDVKRLGVQPSTRKWAYGWIVDKLQRSGKIGMLVDFGGGGVDTYIAGRLLHYARTW